MNAPPERSERLNFAERWLRDALIESRPPAFFLSIDADMTRCEEALRQMRAQGVRVTLTHMMIHAAAKQLAAHPDIHQMVCGNRRYFPTSVDVAISVAGTTFVAPTMVIERADQKTLPEIVDEVRQRAPVVRKEAKQQLEFLKSWGWIVPFGFLRRRIFRFLISRMSFRRKGSGTFQISSAPAVDVGITFAFTSTAILSFGRVRPRPVVVDRQVVVRPVITLACSADHGVWDGRMAEIFLLNVKAFLEKFTRDEQLSPRPEEPPHEHELS